MKDNITVFKEYIRIISYIEIALFIVSLFLIYPILNMMVSLFKTNLYNFSMFSEFELQATIFVNIFGLLTLWVLGTAFALFMQEKKLLWNTIKVLGTLTTSYVLCLVFLVPYILNQMALYSTGIAMFSITDVIKNSFIISTIITAGISLMFIIPFIHKNIISLEFITNKRPVLYIVMTILSMILTPTGDAITMLCTLLPAIICMEIGMYKMNINKEMKKCLE